MKNRRKIVNFRTLLTALVLFTAFQASFAGSREAYADLWLRGTMEEKRLFVTGIAIGLSLMKNYSKALMQESKGDFAEVDSVSGEACKVYIDRIYQELSYLEHGFKEENVVKAMDALYKKEKNRDFPFQQMYTIALMEIKRLRKDAGGK